MYARALVYVEVIRASCFDQPVRFVKNADSIMLTSLVLGDV